MEEYKYLIIGGGVAGTTATETLRQNDKDGSIAIVSDEPYIFYSRIMLSKPNFFLGKIPFDNIWLRKKEWYEQNKIIFLSREIAVKLNSQAKTVELKSGKILKYQKLLIATGGEAKTWNLPEGDKKGVCYLRDLNQAKELIGNVETAKKAVVIGSGFVSFEMGEMMRLVGLEVTLIMREPYYWYPLLDEESGKMVEDAMENGGVKILRNSEVAEIKGDQKIEGVILKNGEKINCDLALVGIGLVCNLDWVKNAGVEIKCGILANEYLETNIPDIYTAGDVAEFNDLVLGEKIQLGNWVNAQMQGRTVALNMLGKHQPFKFVSFYTAQGFGLNIAMSGDVRIKPEYKIIKRDSPEINSFARIIVDGNDEIIGATFINRTQDMSVINKLIETNFKISDHESELADINFD
ncbi:MAG: FAD-dependent oxidoreductase, partial [Patescibacteria group bacterium]